MSLAGRVSQAAIAELMTLQGPYFPPDFNATHPAFAPASELPWLEGDFLDAYPSTALSDPFLALVAGSAMNTTLAQLSGNQVSQHCMLPTLRVDAYRQLRHCRS